ncbi:MAG: hypothetical protein JST04_04365 [Bdellovibrionales bacterium]|nr:hypothetical protein [Bdellovibrionales bacterium]
MNSKISSSLLPRRSILLALAALTGCSTGNLKLDLNDSRPLPASRRPAEGGNGGPRGGGDPVAGEFMEYERVALAKMEAWAKQGKLSITEDELAKIRAIMPPNEAKDPKHLVTTEAHVCLDNRKNSQGECVDPSSERYAVKEPFAKPPHIYVGRARAADPSTTPLQKEIVAGHELRGIALSRPGENFADEDFSNTYATLNAAAKEWNALVRTHLDYLRRIRLYDEMNEIVDLGYFQSVKDTFVETSDDYKRCVNASNAEVNEIYSIETKMAKKIEKKAKKRKSGDLFGNLRDIEEGERQLLKDTDVWRACDRAMDQFANALMKNGAPKIQEQLNQIRAKVLATVTEWQNWANSVPNPQWRNWLFQKMQHYIDLRNDAFRRFSAGDQKFVLGERGTFSSAKDNGYAPDDAKIAKDLNPVLDKACPPEVVHKDFRVATKCNVDAGVPAANAYFKTFLSRNVDDLIAAHDQAVDEVAGQVDPL